MKNILVIGGAGYIGSHMTHKLLNENYNVLVYDNLSTGHRKAILGDFIEGDINDKEKLIETIKNNNIDTIMHFAAFIEVGESVGHPSKYYNNNLVGVINLLDTMALCNVKYFVFSSTAATFGVPVYDQIDEKHPQVPVNPYGKTKYMVEEILKDYDEAYGIKSAVLRYFNAAGADDSGKLGESHNPESHLIPLILQTANNRRDYIEVYGEDYETKDGTCVRDFIHVNDLAEAHLKAIQKVQKENKSFDYNLGTGVGYTVKEVIDTVKKITGKQFKVNYGPRRPGDVKKLVANGMKAQVELDWKANYSLEDIIKSAWNWERYRLY